MVLGIARPKGLSLVGQDRAGRARLACSAIEDRLRQILLNLLTNAVKFTLARQRQPADHHEGAPGDGERVKFAVVDTGIGIPEDRLTRLFNRFTQADATIRDRFGGTGLGLAICKQLVERMGGEIGVETALGYGSTFWFTVALPRASASVAAGARSAAGRGAARRTSALLLVEDRPHEPGDRPHLSRACRLRGATSSTTAPDAIRAVQNAPFDAVLMDMQMPEMDGLEATRRIRALGGEFARLPIIALSAGVLPNDVSQCYAAGMNDHLGKPFDREEM